MNHDFIENQLVCLTKETLDTFLEADNPAELISLYTFYYYTAKWQSTNQVKCTTQFVSDALKWAEPKVRKIKKQLIDFGLIEDVKERNEKGVVIGHYIKINYIFKKSSEIHTVENPQYGLDHRVDLTTPNALSTNRLNILLNNNIKNMFSKESIKSINDWLEYKKEKKQSYKEKGLTVLLKRLAKLAEEKGQQAVIDAIEYSMSNNYTGVYEAPASAKKGNDNGTNDSNPKWDGLNLGTIL